MNTKKILGVVAVLALIAVAMVGAGAAADQTASNGAELTAAVANVGNNEKITVTADITDAVGIKVTEGKNFTLDLNGHTITFIGPGEGSYGTQNQAFQILKGATVIFKNGTLKCSADNKTAAQPSAEGDPKPISRFIQNYGTLTITDMTFDGANLNQNISDNKKVLIESDCGAVTINGETYITADVANDWRALYIDTWKIEVYAGGTQVTIDTTGVITGSVEMYTEGDYSGTVTTSTLTIDNGTFIAPKNVVYINQRGTATVNGGTFTATSTTPETQVFRVEGTGSTLNLYKGTVKGDYQYGVYSKNGGNVVLGTAGDALDALKITTKYAAVSGNNIAQPENFTINNGTFISTLAAEGLTQAASAVYLPCNGEIIINGGSFTGVNNSIVIPYATKSYANTTVDINGGIFNAPIAIAEGNGASAGVVTLDIASSVDAVVETSESNSAVTNTPYSLAVALAHVSSGTIEIGEDTNVSTSLTIPAGVKLVVPAGKELKTSGTDGKITVTGELIVEGNFSGKLGAISNQTLIITESGKADVVFETFPSGKVIELSSGAVLTISKDDSHTIDEVNDVIKSAEAGAVVVKETSSGNTAEKFNSDYDGTGTPDVTPVVVPTGGSTFVSTTAQVTYEISIPSSVTLEDGTVSEKVYSITIKRPDIVSGQKVVMDLSSSTYMKNSNLAVKLNNASDIDANKVAFAAGKTNTSGAISGLILPSSSPMVVECSTYVDANYTEPQTVYFKATEDIKKAGTYSDTLTFTVGIEPDTA